MAGAHRPTLDNIKIIISGIAKCYRFGMAQAEFPWLDGIIDLYIGRIESWQLPGSIAKDLK
jgi:hypothetical protein